MHTFKVFKKTTRFKKFSKGITLFVRRKNIKRRLKSSLIFNTVVSASWLRSYLCAKRFFVAYQAMYTTQFIATLSSVNFSYNKKSPNALTYSYMSTTKNNPFAYCGNSRTLSQLSKLNDKTVNSILIGTDLYNANSVQKANVLAASTISILNSLSVNYLNRLIKEIRKVITLLTLLSSLK